MKEFNLLREPWICVLKHNGQTEEVSLLTALERAHEFHRLAGELPTQDVAVLRLLLATVYATFTNMDSHGKPGRITNAREALERWEDIWKLGRFPYEILEKHLCRYEERFYLFHPERPFFQVAGLRKKYAKKGKEINPIAQIISDVPSRPTRRFMCLRSGEGYEALSFSEAARWLVSMQSWDYAGKKANVVDGNPDGGGTGWLGKIGVVYPVAHTLFETLMLNFVLLEPNGEVLPYGLPTWEEEDLPTPEKVERRPMGYCELLTWQSRRVGLFRGKGSESSKVTGVLASYGDVFQAADMTIEQMTGWHIGVKGETKGHYIPNRHEKERILWPSLSSILPKANNGINETNLPPAVLQWVALLRERKVIPNDVIQVCAVGFHYGTMSAIIEEMTADTFEIHAGVLSQLNEDWLLKISDILSLTDSCVRLVGRLATDLIMASGGSENVLEKAPKYKYKAEAYYRLDIPFRKWLVGINPEQTDIAHAEQDWKDTVRHVLLEFGEEITSQCGERGIVGRWVKSEKDDSQKILYTAPGAMAKFRSAINNITRKGELADGNN